MIELAEIFRRHAPEYLARFGSAMPVEHRRAIDAILRCRTPGAGGHLYECGECAHRHFAWHSCNHRSCPKCGGADAAAWEERQKAKLLPAPYFLVTFTLPAEMRKVCQRHPEVIHRLLFEESAGTLKEIAANPRHLGAELGFLGVLHTWTRQLAYHPHIHYIIPGGGLREDGLREDGRKWRKCRTTKKGEPYLLPVQVLSRRFRTRMAMALREQAPELYAQVPRSAWSKGWVVHSQGCGNGEAALGYLAGYVKRTALSNKRLLADEAGTITVGYTESGSGARKRVKLDAMTFMARVLSHVLPSGLHKVRYYGWLHPRARSRLLRVQTLLAAPLVFKAAPADAAQPVHLRCPRCGLYSLKIIGRLLRPRPP